MKKLVLTAILIGSLVGCTAQVQQPNIDNLIHAEPRWTYLDSSPSFDILSFVEETSRHREGRFAYVWGAAVSSQAKHKADTSTGLLKFDCLTRHVASVIERDYAKGQKIREKAFETDQWNYVKQGSIYEMYYQVACFDKRFNHRGIMIEGSIQAYWKSILDGMLAAQADRKAMQQQQTK